MPGPASSVWAVVVAGGAGSRFGGPKQFAQLGGRRVLDWSVAAAASVAAGVILVLPAEQLDDRSATCWPVDQVVAGGRTRSDSVRAGLAAVPADAQVIVVHDGARPLASPALFSLVVRALDHHGAAGALPALAVAETLKRVDGDRVSATVDRTNLVVVQTPQAFAAHALRQAHADGTEATDDAALVEAAGGVVVVVPGEATNIKLTLPGDLRVAEMMMGR
ncbi:MAG: 2-C-methyl-D-erythritol 4-phosphate cytidylyltransferase [Acidimicrobiales bacterium]